ncbi:MAG: glycosyl hydrolase [Lutimonas sp.]
MKRFSLSTMLLLALIYTGASCQNNKEITPERPEQNPIRKDLISVRGQGILFGHQDDLAYGVDWHYEEGGSDVKRVAGDFPALFGWELGGLERGDTHNLDSVPFEKMRDLALKAHEMGGINTFSWHPYEVIEGRSSWTRDAEIVKHILPGAEYHEAFKLQLDRVAQFLKSIKRIDGESIPFIFRPWHEMDGAWFWWGSEQCSPEEFQKLFAFTVNYLREEKGIQNMLVAYSPDRNFNSSDKYLTWYPGDGYVDILGVDNYHDLKQEQGYLEAIEKLHIVIAESKKRNKLSALTETGLENVTDTAWYPEMLGAVLEDSLVQKEISYVMVWRNDPKVHFFFPYPGHPAADGAKTLLERERIFLLSDYNEAKKKARNTDGK